MDAGHISSVLLFMGAKCNEAGGQKLSMNLI